MRIMKEVNKLDKKDEVTIIKLNSNGHTATVASQVAAHELVGQSLDEGQFAFCEPEKIIVTEKEKLKDLFLEKVIIFSPVAGG